ncbi:MAG TPA: rhomboid family intramembrane serine protease [Bacteroidales bacterium]|nr:rhomboid family intramembrane serine protease [Bacteroidales bacterium]
MEITYGIILFTVVVSIVCFNNEELFNRLKFNAFDVKHSNQWYRFFSYGFLHSGWVHLLINMVVFYSFGTIVEQVFRGFFKEKYILYYILLYLGGLLLSIIPAYGKYKNDVFYNAVGASGAVSSVVFASIIILPKAPISFFFIPVEIPAWIFGVLYIIYEFYMSRKAKDNIGHDAHFWGAVYGVIFTIALKPSLAIGFLQQIGFLH